MNDRKRDYVEFIYNEKDRPFTTYPDQLTRYLFDRFGLRQGQSLLDVGCGRGEFLRGFMKCGVEGFGVDQSAVARKICPQAEIHTGDLEKETLPFDDNSMDAVFSKSVIEHFRDPEILVDETYRIVKPGGLVISMAPAWEYNMPNFYVDYTHRTPFTLVSIRDIHLMCGFEEVEAEYFRQLPVLWAHPWMILFSEAARLFTPTALKPYSKFVFFSKELMLLSVARKPVTG